MMLLRSLEILTSLSLVFALKNGVGVTPAMGWNPYNAFSCVQNVFPVEQR